MKSINLFKSFTENITEKIKDFFFKKEHRNSPKDFTRKRIMDFRTVMLTMLNFKTESSELSAYNVTSEIMDVECVSGCAFDKARDKINSSAFKELYEDSVQMALSVEDPKVFAGYRVGAVDGTVSLLPKSDDLKKEYGQTTPVEGKIYARVSFCADVLNGVLLDGEISSFSVGERKLALEHIKKQLAPDLLYLFDRGYWSPELVDAIINANQKFVFRLSSNTIAKVTNSKDTSGYFTIKYNDREHTLRYYKFELSSGEMEYLATNLSHEEVPDSQLPELYHLRWGVETKYDELKNRLDFENFSGKNINAIKQDFYATMTVMNMTAFAIAAADVIVKEKRVGKDNKYERKPNGNTATGILKDRLIRVFIEDDPNIRVEMLNKLIKDISKFTIPDMPDRHFPRSKTDKCRKRRRRKTPL